MAYSSHSLVQLFRNSRRNQRPYTWVATIICILITIHFFYFNPKTVGFFDRANFFKNENSDYPPRYTSIREIELNLPQHNLDLPFPEGKNGRYVRFSCQAQQLGWNNILGELLMNSHLAHESNRAFVFPDFYWPEEHYSWPKSKYRSTPPRTPLSALLSGPTVGAPWPVGDPAPRSVSEAWYDIVCPPKRRRVIITRELKPHLGSSPGNEVFAAWKKALLEAPEPCIEIKGVPIEEDMFSQVFDLWLFGSTRVLSIWDSFATSPVSRLLGPSVPVQRNLDSNRLLFHASPKEVVGVKPFSRMLAIHLRRGDYKQACVHFSNWNSTYYSWNLHEFLPDKFVGVHNGSYGTNSPENEALFIKHCQPTNEEILAKIRRSRTEYLEAVAKAGGKEDIDVLYLMTNDQTGWVDEVREIMKASGWRVVATSRDLVLDSEGKDVSMAIDMEIARRASVFIGNGWSSFTSNIIHRRLVDGKIPMSNRFY